MKSRRVVPRFKPLLLSLLLVVLLGLAATAWARPRIIRWYEIRQLTSPNTVKREAALNYVLHHGMSDGALVAGAMQKLDTADDINFRQIVHVLERIHQWHRPLVPDGPWLRWLADDPRGKEPQGRIFTAHYLAELPHLSRDAKLLTMLSHLLNDENGDVRYAALLAVAELAGEAKDTTELRPLMVRGTVDATPEIARQAWIFLGLLKWTKGVPADWSKAAPYVAEAMLWAKVYGQPDQPGPALEALTGAGATPVQRAMAIYPLHWSTDPSAQEALLNILRQALPVKTAKTDPLVLWRAMLSVATPGSGEASPLLYAWAEQAYYSDVWYSQAMWPIINAACYRTGVPYALVLHPDSPTTHAAHDDRDNITRLAALEGAAQGKVEQPVDESTPDMLRLAAVAGTKSPKPEDLRELFNSEESTMRDLACIVAAERFTKEQNTELIKSLLHDFDDNAKIAGAVISGLTKIRPRETKTVNGKTEEYDLLERRLRDEDRWLVQTMIKLSLWMQGEKSDIANMTSGLFVRTDVPHTTVILILLHQHDLAGADFLFNPRGEPPMNLVELLDEKRWWRVLSHFLPKDAPPLWVWADPELEQFQIDVLRDWYLVNRQKMGGR